MSWSDDSLIKSLEMQRQQAIYGLENGEKSKQNQLTRLKAFAAAQVIWRIGPYNADSVINQDLRWTCYTL